MIDAVNRSDEKNSIFKIQNKQPIIQEIKPVDQKNRSAKLFWNKYSKIDNRKWIFSKKLLDSGFVFGNVK